MNQDILATIGSILPYDRQRDAVHIAIISAVADEPLKAGQPVWVRDGRARARVDGGHAYAVIDPFLIGGVKQGERCWLFLSPGSITSLRHDWTHPFFPHVEQRPKVEESRAWLDDHAAQFGIRVDVLIEQAVSGGDVCYGEDAGSDWASDPQNRAEFWSHLENVTGRTFSHEHRAGTMFSCRC